LNEVIAGTVDGHDIAVAVVTYEREPEMGDEITTLLHGVRSVRRAYNALDVAVREVRP
jgi:hypothetical protein